jgi:hypothetical protein
MQGRIVLESHFVLSPTFYVINKTFFEISKFFRKYREKTG